MVQVLQVFDADELLDTILLIIIFAVLLGAVARMYVRWKRRRMAQGLQVFDKDGSLDVDLAECCSSNTDNDNAIHASSRTDRDGRDTVPCENTLRT